MVYLLFFASGASTLALEIVWTRLFTVLLGSTHAALASVVAATMGGLGVGSLWGGRLADRTPSPLKLFGMLVMAGGFLSLVLPWILPVAVPLLRVAYRWTGGEGPVLTALRIAVAAAFLLPPTVLFGATLPVLSTAVSRGRDKKSARIGWLYAVNTFGAVVGAVVAGAWSLSAIGITATNGCAAGLHIAIGVAARWLVRKPKTQAAGVHHDRRSHRKARARAGAREAGTGLRAAALCLGATGMAGMMLELGWTRALVLSIGNSTYTFTVVLASFVAGFALGSALAARVAGRTNRPDAALGWLTGALAMAALLSIPVLGFLPLIAVKLFSHELSLGGVLGLGIVVAGVFFVPAAALSGACFPFACRLGLGTGGAVGRGVGWIAGLNTLGAVAGSLLAGFAIIPLTGFVWPTIALTVILLCVVSTWLLARSDRRRSAVAVPVVLTALFLLIRPHGVLGRTSYAWHPAVLASGPFLYAHDWQAESRNLSELGRAIVETNQVVFYRDSPSASVAVLSEGRGSDFVLRISGKIDASTGGGSVSDLPTELLLGHLPILLHPAPQRVLTIGLGSGVTLGAILRHRVEAVDSIEISGDVVEAARRFFAEANGRALEDGRVRTIIGDARNHLLLTADRYDIITSEPSNPWVAGMGALFTEECFRLCRQRLLPGGVMCQWIHAAAIDPRDFKLVLRTFARVFPGAQVWLMDYDCLLVGGAPRLDGARFTEAIQVGAVREDLERIGIRAPRDFFQYLGPAAADFAGSGSIHRDDRPVLEFRGPFGLYRSSMELLSELASPPCPLIPAAAIAGAPAGFAGQVDRAREALGWTRRIALKAYSRAWDDCDRLLNDLIRAEEGVIRLVLEGVVEDRRQSLLRAICRHRSLRSRVSALAIERLPGEPRWLGAATVAAHDDAPALRKLGEALLKARAFDQAHAMLLRGAELDPRDAYARYFLGLVAGERGQLEAAKDHFDQAARLDPTSATIRYNLGFALESLGQTGEAEKAYREAIRLEQRHGDTHSKICTGLARLIMKRNGLIGEAITWIEKAVDITGQRDLSLLRYLAQLYERAGRRAEAAACRRRIKEVEDQPSNQTTQQ